MTNEAKKGLLSIFQFVFALAILILLSSPALSNKGETYTSYELITGFKYNNVEMTGFSFLNLLPFLLLALCFILDFLKYAHRIFDNKIVRIIIIALYIIIGVMLLLSRYMINITNPNSGYMKYFDTLSYSDTICFGVVLQASIAFFCALIGVLDLIIPHDQVIDQVEEKKNEVNDLMNEYKDLLDDNKENESLNNKIDE